MHINQPLVSVIITTYQNEALLPRAIDSVLRQSYAPVELIVVDDNPPESPARAATEAVMERYPQAIYLRHPENRNGAAARNTGIRAAKGTYIAFLDNDDFYFSNHIAACVEAMELEPSSVCALSGVVKIRGGLCWEIIRPPEEEDMVKALLFSERALGTGSNLFLRADAVRAQNGFDEAFIRHQDVEFALRIFAQGSVCRLQEVQIVKEMDGFSNAPKFERFLAAKRQLWEKYRSLLDGLSAAEQKRFYAAQYSALLYTACLERDRTQICWVKTQLKNLDAWTGRNQILFLMGILGLLPLYEWCKRKTKARRSEKLYREVTAGLSEADRDVLRAALGSKGEGVSV